MLWMDSSVPFGAVIRYLPGPMASVDTPGHPVPERSDDDLLRAVARGDATAFEALYRRHRDWTFRVACRFCRGPEDAADVVQETFAYLLARAPRLRLTARLTTYLYPVVRSIAVERIRRQRRMRLGGVGEGPDAAVDPTGPALPATGLDPALEAAVAALPEGQREVLLMRAVDEMSLAEIAVALGIPVGTVKSRLHHALAALRADERVRGIFENE